MRKGIKIALIVAGGMIVLGGVTLAVIGGCIHTGRIAAPALDPARIGEVVYQEETFSIADDGSVRVHVTTDDVTVGVSDDALVHLSYDDTAFMEHVTMENEKGVVLTQEVLSQTRLPDFVRWFSEGNVRTQVSVLLPKTFRGELVVSAATGDITVSEQQPGLLALDCTTGALRVTDVTCTTAVLGTATGPLRLSDTVVDGDLTVTSTTGDATLKNVTAAALERRASTGETELTDVSAKSVFIDASTGSVHLSRLETEKLTVNLTTGSVRGSLKGTEQDYRDALSLHTSTGDVDIKYTD